MSLDALPEHLGDAGDLARLLARALLSGQWPPGAAFPKELDIAKHFAISRNQVRTALARLTAAGLLERTAGRGSVVRAIDEWHLMDPAVSSWMTGLNRLDPQLIQAIYAFRLSAEPVVAALAAQKAGPEDIHRLSQAFKGMQQSAQQDRAAHAEFDVQFHDAIYNASHNLVWRQMGHLLRPSIMALVEGSQNQLLTLDDSLTRHARLLEAIETGDAHAASAAARQVLQRTAKDLGLDDEYLAKNLAPGSNRLSKERP
ncbi:FCD domain-containing protein [Halomonas sp. PAMB 3264]|uniref:FadR/GntR family transcriptional regulator n=1 Tax=Halomonas sp. PAMB 3264 TaxID=3075222 RepID=UPI00289E15B6|nr:FCD domain-containing protein [Halomonas sp. PAMB 3264]WNL41023.1 FCD domain-containing protein [Halomonas sp. PAMB 3264]